MARAKRTSKPTTRSGVRQQLEALRADPSFIANEARGDKATLDRLLDSDIMKPAWRQINRLARADEYLPTDFLVTALALRRAWARTSRTPTAEAKRNLKDIGKAAKGLARQLRAHKADIRLLTAYGTELQALILGVLESQGHSASAEAIRATAQPALPTHAAVLDHLAAVLTAGTKSTQPPIGGRPAKPRAANAERTYCVQQLASFFEERCGEVPLTLLSCTVTALLKLRDPLDPVHVAHLIRR